MTFLATATIVAATETTRKVTDAKPAGFFLQLTDASGNVVDSKTGTGLTYEFPGLSAGTYSLSAQLRDTDDVTIGGVARAEFTITDAPVDTLTVKSVSGVSVTVTAENAAPAPAPTPAPVVPGDLGPGVTVPAAAPAVNPGVDPSTVAIPGNVVNAPQA